MICAVVLAAGRSQRMGTHKMLLDCGGKPLIAHVVDQLLAAKLDPAWHGHLAHDSRAGCPCHIYVVTGHNPEAVAGALAARTVTLVANPDYEQGMLSSVRRGFAAMPETCRAVLVTLGDQPAITPDLVNQLIDAHNKTQKGIVVPVHNNRRGHPTLIAAKYRHAVMTQYDNVGLRGLLHDHPDDVLELPAPDLDVTIDLDTPDDYARHLRNKTHPPHTT